jgi:SsrA-binding protein
MANKEVNIRNKRARFEYQLFDIYTAGMQLCGTEIKSIRKVNTFQVISTRN